MRDVRAQFFLTFAVLGAVLPYAPVFFRDAGLSQGDVGLAFAIWSGVQIFTPAAVAWAADARLDPRRLVVGCSAVSAAGLLALGFVRGGGPVLAAWAAFCAASVPLLPLIDGIYFSLRRRESEAGHRSGRPYHRVRVWGTIGYMLPSVLLFWLLRYKLVGVAGALMSGAAFAVLAGVQGALLPDPRSRPAVVPPTARHGCDGSPLPPYRGLPTAAAARTLLRPPLLAFCTASVLAQAAGAAMAAFYPVYLTERVSIGSDWIGPITQVGVVVEMFFVYASGWLVARFGVKGLLLAGLTGTAARLGWLAHSATPAAAVGSQLFHGVYLVTTGVVPQTLLDRHAADDCRHSVQGVFVMLMGCGKVLGSLAAGAVAAHSVQAVFGYGALLCAATAAFTAVAFRETQRGPDRQDAPGQLVTDGRG